MFDEYLTPASTGQAEFIEKRSRFIGRCAPASTQSEAALFVSSIRDRHRDATHNVYAYSLKTDLLTKSTDDGEPAGTAGMPVLEVLTKRKLFDAVIVVTRYFGGVLLGTGGLVRAYSLAASMAADAAGTAEMRRCERLSLAVDYAVYEPVERMIASFGARTLSRDFAQSVTLEIILPVEALSGLVEALRALLRAEPEIKKLGTEFFPL